jgi:ribosomal protein S27AE
MPSVTYECGDCGHEEERDLRKVYGETDYEDDYEVIGDEVEKCPQCGSTDLTDYTTGVSSSMSEREDFHSDG